MKVAVSNRQRAIALNAARVRQLVRFFMTRKRRAAPLQAWDCVSVVIADHALMRAVNRDFLNSPETTDVISFQFAPVPGEGSRALQGEILVNAELAAEYAPAAAHRELSLYLAHGCDHLMGADDALPDGRRSMHRRELRWLAEASAKGLTRLKR